MPAPTSPASAKNAGLAINDHKALPKALTLVAAPLIIPAKPPPDDASPAKLDPSLLLPKMADLIASS